MESYTESSLESSTESSIESSMKNDTESSNDLDGTKKYSICGFNEKIVMD